MVFRSLLFQGHVIDLFKGHVIDMGRPESISVRYRGKATERAGRLKPITFTGKRNSALGA